MPQESEQQDYETQPPPKDGTIAAQGYFGAAISAFRLLDFIVDLVTRIDRVAYRARQVLEGSHQCKSLEPSALATTDAGRATKFLRQNKQILLELFLTRLVDNFQTYLVDLVRAVLHSKPAMLSTSQRALTLEELLKYDRIEDLVHDIVERQVNDLAYEGFIQLRSWCEKRGLEVNVPDTDVDAVVELIATRNVIAHNRGLVDEKYLRAVPNPRFRLGEVRSIHVDDLFSALGLLNQVVAGTDRLAAEKFQLPTTPLSADDVFARGFRELRA